MENVSPKRIGIIYGCIYIYIYREREREREGESERKREMYLYRDVYRRLISWCHCTLRRCWRHEFIWNWFLVHVDISTDSIWSAKRRDVRVVSLKITWPGESFHVYPELVTSSRQQTETRNTLPKLYKQHVPPIKSGKNEYPNQD